MHNINYYSCSILEGPIEASCQLVPLCQQMSVRSIDGTAGNCYSPISRRILLYPVPESHFFELILLDSLHYMIGQLFPTYQSGAKRTCVIIVILRQVPAVSACREAEFRRRRSVILFRGL